jgi:hypothetical protein
MGLKADITRHWVHSQEEDTEAGMVYRPVEHELPAARGRAALKLNRDGTCQYYGIGRGDRPEAAPGKWTLEEGDPPHIRVRFDSGEKMDLQIVSANRDKLVVAPE